MANIHARAEVGYISVILCTRGATGNSGSPLFYAVLQTPIPCGDIPSNPFCVKVPISTVIECKEKVFDKTCF